MTTTVQIKLLPTPEQKVLIDTACKKYIATVNKIVAMYVTENQALRLTSKDVIAPLPSKLRCQAIRDAKNVFRKYTKDVKKAEWLKAKYPDREVKPVVVPILRKPVAIWNNQGYKVTDAAVDFPVLKEGECYRISVNALIPADVYDKLSTHKLGTLRITTKNGKYIAQIAIEQELTQSDNTGVMGVDLGIKCPAVCVTDTGKVKFVGNGRKNKYIRRRFASKRKKLGKRKKLNAIRKMSNKEHRIMQDIDHKLSRQIVNFAIDNGIGTIRLEDLANVRKETRTSRKNNRSLSNWSFYRMAQYIEYKAALVGISVEYVNPAFTSQCCPICGKFNHAKGRNYVCSCGYHSHRDLVGAINICKAAPVSSGNSLAA